MEESKRVLEVGVKAIIKNKEGKYLLLQRTKPYAGDTILKWDAPGGRIHIGETLREALQREIKEETGMRLVGDPQLIFAQDILRVETKHTIRLTYIVETEGEIALHPEEHVAYGWYTLDEIEKLQYDTYLNQVLKILM